MYEVKLPRLGQTMQSGTITTWLVDEGDSIEKGEALFELQSEKSTIEVEAQDSGILRKIIVPEDEEVPINTVIGVIADEDEEIDFSHFTASYKHEPIPPTENQNKQVEKTLKTVTTVRRGGVSPRARRLAKELGVDLDTISGSGKNGIVTEDDVRNAAVSSRIKVKETIKLNNIQKSMAENMLNSWQTIPQFTQMVSVNMEKVLRIKKELEHVSLNAIITKAIGKAVMTVPIVNSRLVNNQITVYDEVNISTAINSPNGLVVPVLKNVENKSPEDITNEIKQLVVKADNNGLTMDDYADGTITVSNLGSTGIETGTPIINSPQAAIVFIGAIKRVPVVDEHDQIVVAPMMSLSICFDHRFIDGATGAQFTNAVKVILGNLIIDDLY